MKRIIIIIFMLVETISLKDICFASDFPEIHGFGEAAFGLKVSDDGKANKDGYNMLEQRMEFKLRYLPELDLLKRWNTEVFFKTDIVMDEYTERAKWWAPRELYISFTPLSFADFKIGEQILTWGTGEYIFINDQFPKDYESFLIGRDDDYLKRPSYALRGTLSGSWASLDIAAIPIFTPNKVIDGERLSFFDSLKGGIVGRESDRFLVEPARQFENTEIAGRAYGTVKSYEWALYYFHGFNKNPNGYKNEALSQLFYPRHDVYVASLQGPLPFIGGIANAEIGYDYSQEDDAGKDRLIPNSSIQYLVGYKKAFKDDLEIGLQYFITQMLYYENYKRGLRAGDSQDDEVYQQYTFRVTKLFANQTVNLSLFTFYSPVDNDVYFRPTLSWNARDAWRIVVGANIFLGRQNNADYGQYEGNSNIYTRLRYSF